MFISNEEAMMERMYRFPIGTRVRYIGPTPDLDMHAAFIRPGSICRVIDISPPTSDDQNEISPLRYAIEEPGGDRVWVLEQHLEDV